ARCPGRAIGWRSLIAVSVAVLDPLPHIAVHLIETPWVRLERVDRHRSRAAIKVGLAGRDRRTPPERRRCAGARSIFPLRFAQQPISLAGLAREPRHIGLGVIPIDAHRRMQTALHEAGVAPRPAGALLPTAPLVGEALRASIVAGLFD